MKMRKKNILLVCREKHAMPMHFLAKLLREEGDNLAAYLISTPTNHYLIPVIISFSKKIIRISLFMI